MPDSPRNKIDKGNWFVVHRELLNHWVATRPDWLAGWVSILACVDYATGEVTLTDVPIRRHFTPSAWRHLISELARDGMLDNVQTQSLGKCKGAKQTGRVVNWHKFQPSKTRENNDTLNDTGRAEVTTPYNPDQDAENTVSGQRKSSGHDTLNDAQYKEYKNNKEVKEVLPPRQATQPPQEKPSKTTDPWLLRQQFAATDVGRELITCLGAEARRMKLEELERLSTLWTPEEIKAAWKQAKRDATHGTNRVFLLILEGKIALDKSFLPEPKTPARREYRGPQPGDRVKLPDNTIHEVADIDRYGNWVIIPGLDAIRPTDCQVVEAA